MSKRRKQVWVDRETWEKARNVFPGESDPTVSRMLFRYSLAGAESALGDMNKKKRRK